MGLVGELKERETPGLSAVGREVTWRISWMRKNMSALNLFIVDAIVGAFRMVLFGVGSVEV